VPHDACVKTYCASEASYLLDEQVGGARHATSGCARAWYFCRYGGGSMAIQ